MIVNHSASRLRVLIQLRWFMLILQGAGLYPALALGWLDPRRMGAYVSAMALALAANVIASFGLRRQNARVSEGIVFAHLALDVFTCGALFALMGGPWNPLSALFYAYAALGCVMLRGRWREAFLGLILLLIVSLHGIFDLMTPVTPRFIFASPVLLVTQTSVTVLIWFMARYVLRRMQEQSALLGRLERERERARKLEAISATAAGFAHKLATPLNNVKARLHRLDAKMDGAQRDELRSAQTSLAQAEVRLKSIIATSMAYEKEGAMRFQTVDLRLFLTRFVSASGQGRLTLSWADDLPRRLPCTLPVLDVQDALTDLIANALDAAASTVLIRVQSGVRPGTADIMIQDDGPGFPALVLERCGEPFLSTKPEGTGLGLYHAKNLFWALGGTLDIGNGDGSGAFVTVSLPLEDRS